MTTEFTFAMIKSDAVENRLVGRILMRIEDEHFRIAEMQQVRLAPSQAAAFYAEHREKHFFNTLVGFMASGPLVAIVLERGHGWKHDKGVVEHWREVIGATDPRRAALDTIRQRHGDKTGLAIHRNCVHGSATPEATAREIAFFWPSARESLQSAYVEQLTDIGTTLVNAGYLTEEDIGRHGVRFAVRNRFASSIDVLKEGR